MRWLGIDFGERRIGLAISDPEGRLAVPLATLARASDRAAAGEIAAIARREGVGRLVVGEPRDLEGGRGAAAERARRFAARLARAAGLPCELIDEALTSREAAARLAGGGGDRGDLGGRGGGGARGAGRRRRGRGAGGTGVLPGAPGAPGAVDAVAAQILLQDALDRHRRRPLRPGASAG
jgi:putative transcription antitermination factor YqgF